MIGELLKKLVRRLGMYGSYRFARIFRSSQLAALTSPTVSAIPGIPMSGPNSVLPQVASSEFISSLGDDLGLDAEYEKLVDWPSYRLDRVSDELRSDRLYNLWTTTSGGHKWDHYFNIYQELFGERRVKPLHVLEIGVLNGSSLRMWKRYFSNPKTIVVGIDNRPECLKFDAPVYGIHVRIGSQADTAFLKQVIAEFGPFDLIIDDGSHQSSHMIKSFNALFEVGLDDNGIYCVEDLHANYWDAWRDTRKSFLDLCKELVEHMHAHYRRASPASFLVNRPSEQPINSLSVPFVTTLIREIRFFDSIVAIYKTRRKHIPYYMKLNG